MILPNRPIDVAERSRDDRAIQGRPTLTQPPGTNRNAPPRYIHRGGCQRRLAVGGSCHDPATHIHPLPDHCQNPGVHTVTGAGATGVVSAGGGGGATGACTVRSARTSSSGTRQIPAIQIQSLPAQCQ